MTLRYTTALLFLALTLPFPAFSQQPASTFFDDPYLTEALAEADENTPLDVVVFLSPAADLQALKRKFNTENTPVSQRPKAVMRLLKSQAANSQRDLLAFLSASTLTHQNIRTFWIVNAVAVEAVPDLIHALSNREDVDRIILNRKAFAYVAPPARELGDPKSVGGTEPGLVAVGAPQMWAMGYTGKGRLALTFDTGVWDDHPAHRKRFLGNLMPYISTWFPYDSPVPVDKSSSHGTHVTGTMLGLDTATADTIGMAPQAYFIATDPVVSNLALVKPLTDFMFGYEWALNPDGDENTSYDVPDVINNSWGFGPELDEAPCPEFVIPVFTALETAGIANVNSAGNEGPGDQTIGVPHNTNIGLVNSFTVGAIVAQPPYPIASFSSRGPSVCGGTGSLLIKPEVSAPGVDVRSSVDHDGYDLYSGTSMAAPHVSGAVLLLKEAYPFLSGEDILLALYNSAVDLGDEGEDNTYGMGRIDVKAAFDLLSENFEPVPPEASGLDLALTRIDEPDFEILSCTTGDSLTINPSVRVKNLGALTVENYTVRFGIVGQDLDSITVNEPLNPGDAIDVQMPALTIGAIGPLAFHAYVAPLTAEYDVWNNHKIDRWVNIAHYDWQTEGPFVDHFTNGIDSTLWTVYNPDGSVTWDTLTVLQIDGELGPAAHMDHAHYPRDHSQQDHLISPLIVNMPLDNQVLSFDYYYSKRELNPFTNDTLLVTITRLCGGTYPGEELFHEGGSELWTDTIAQYNALPDDPDLWATLSFDLELITDDPFYFSFISLNSNGNNMLIDNVRINDGTSVDDRDRAPHLTLYPNPGDGNVRASWSGMPAELTVYDASGRKVMRRKHLAPNTALRTQGLAPGMYTLKFDWPDGRNTIRKWVKK